jgi:hypothetical protein
MGRASTFAALFEVVAADYAMEQCTAPTQGFEVVRAPAPRAFRQAFRTIR